MNKEKKNGYIDNRPVAIKRMEAQDEGVILKHGDTFDSFGARDVFVWEDNNTYYMHYDAADPDVGWLCSLATSKDLKTWVKHGPILELGKPDEEDSKSASYGTTYFSENKWHMYYLGTPNTFPAPERVPAFPYMTMKATSHSPMGPWTKQKEVIPFRPVPDSYYSDTASPGQIIKHKGEYLQFFSASISFYDEKTKVMAKRTLGIARTNNFDGAWTVDKDPILPLEEQVENSALYYEEQNKTWFLFTNHIGIEEGIGEYTDAIWVYWSEDLNKWNRDNKAVVLDNQNCTWSDKIIGLPSVVRVKDKLAVFYDGLSDESTSHCHRDVGLAWLNLPLEIPE
ncbi:MAG: hypothetical protein OCD02_07220 [Spirochaetaceae bacterium]